MSILNKIIKKKDEKKDKAVSEETEKKKVVNKKTVKKETKDNKKDKSSVKVKKNKKISKDKIPNHYFDLVKKPHISEKTFNLSNENQYVFVVSDSANKSEIKKAIGGLYGVSVVSVNVISVPSKPKKFKGRQGVKSGYKKAIVKLAKGSTIDLMKEAK